MSYLSQTLLMCSSNVISRFLLCSQIKRAAREMGQKARRERYSSILILTQRYDALLLAKVKRQY